MWEQFYRLHLKHSKVGLSNFAHGKKIVLYPLIQGCEKAVKRHPWFHKYRWTDFL